MASTGSAKAIVTPLLCISFNVAEIMEKIGAEAVLAEVRIKSGKVVDDVVVFFEALQLC